MRAPHWIGFLVVACAAPPPAATTDAAMPSDGLASHDAPPEATPPRDAAPPPYDAGPAPPCTLAPFVRRFAERPPGSRASDPGGLVLVPGGSLVATRTSVPPAAGDAGAPGRETVELYPLDPEARPRAAPVTVFDGAAAGTRASSPALVATREGAFVLFVESHRTPSANDSVLRLRGGPVDPLGAGRAPLLRDRFADPLAAALPDGTLLVLAARQIATLDAGVVLASPMALHLAADGSSRAPGDVDVGAFVPLDVPALVLRSGPRGAALGFALGRDLHVVRFGPDARVDAHGAYVSRDLGAAALEDLAVLDDAVVATWSSPQGDGSRVHAAVLDPRGDVRSVREVATVSERSRTLVTALPAHGGAALLWSEGRGPSTRVRTAVVQPNGVVRHGATTLLDTPNLEGRIAAVASGRELTFAARDQAGATQGLYLGRACLPP